MGCLLTPRIVTDGSNTVIGDVMVTQALSPEGVAHIDAVRKVSRRIEIGVKPSLTRAQCGTDQVIVSCHSFGLCLNGDLGWMIWLPHLSDSSACVVRYENNCKHHAIVQTPLGADGIIDGRWNPTLQLYGINNRNYGTSSENSWSESYTCLRFTIPTNTFPDSMPITSAEIYYVVQGSSSATPLDEAYNFRFVLFPQPLPLNDPDAVFEQMQLRSPQHRSRRHA